ncbi:MAG TPA: hypothetical protein VFR51_05035, partial [Pyrinomonadaceae bacterium]|nr:hypothetical protein [Pyrinomonadaceae bacterium]
MRETKCETVRRELEELMLGEDCSMTATQHLRECGDCREFHQKQTKLRQIVGGLGVIEAPADFDFRLRARLASESSSAGFHLRSMQWSFATKGFAAATMILLFIGAVVYLRTNVNEAARQKVAVQQAPEPPQSGARPVDSNVVVPQQTPVVASDSGPRSVKRSERKVTAKAKTPLVAVDFGVEPPTVISNSQLHSPIFPIDASVQSLRFSFDDGRGNARTISVPTITFGSQRVLPATTQLAQKRNTVW